MNIYRRVLKLVKPYWAVLTVSIITSLIYVALNSTSIWLTASFTKVLFPATSDTETSQVIPVVPEKGKGSLNDTLKNYTDRLILRDTPLESLSSLPDNFLNFSIEKRFSIYQECLGRFRPTADD